MIAYDLDTTSPSALAAERRGYVDFAAILVGGVRIGSVYADPDSGLYTGCVDGDMHLVLTSTDRGVAIDRVLERFEVMTFVG